MVTDMNGVADDELRSGEGIRVDSEFGAAVVSDQNRAWGCTHEREGEFLVERMEREGHWWRRNRPERGGDRTDRTRGRRPSPPRLLAVVALGDQKRLPENLIGLRGPYIGGGGRF